VVPNLLSVLQEVRACTVCAPYLPLGPKPLLAAGPRSRILLIGQAPGRVAHESGVPWSDRSGDRLRDWLGISKATFYDANTMAIVPMGFCYPGTSPKGDLAPRAECSELWHKTIFSSLRSIQLRIYLGRYAFAQYLGKTYEDLTKAVHDYSRLLPSSIVLPHPSPRNALWLKRNPWFESQLIPALRKEVAGILNK
jgi:uracil-DNA glycosylase